jgi:hypothetical protein
MAASAWCCANLTATKSEISRVVRDADHTIGAAADPRASNADYPMTADSREP